VRLVQPVSPANVVPKSRIGKSVFNFFMFISLDKHGRKILPSKPGRQ
jgi:hypothetical protein